MKEKCFCENRYCIDKKDQRRMCLKDYEVIVDGTAAECQAWMTEIMQGTDDQIPNKYCNLNL